MKLGLALALGVFIVGRIAPAHALDCAKASSPVDKMICATPELKKADAAMSAAYFKLLRATTDRDFHEALIESQRRWLGVRSHGADRFGAAKDDDTDDRKVLLEVTRARLDFLHGPGPIRAMEQQRKIASGDTGGPFAGYKTSCFLLPPPYGSWNYGCFGAAHRQNHDRVCSIAMNWASGHISEDRLVSDLKDGAPKPVAVCSTNYAGTTAQCPDPDNDAETKAIAHWNTNPAPSLGLPMPQASGLWKYDPDIEPDLTDQPWMHDCLFAATFPSADVSRADPAPKKP